MKDSIKLSIILSFIYGSIILFLVVIISMVIINYDITSAFKEINPTAEEINTISNEESNSTAKEEEVYIDISGDPIIKVYLTKEDKIIDVMLEEYVTSVVAGEMQSSFNDEALKAQAIASRTYILSKKNNKCSQAKGADVCDSTHCQVYSSKEKRIDSWGEKLGNQYWDKFKSSVENTKGKVLTYNDELVMYPLFFSTSSGNTENSIDVFSSDIPYLQAIDSPNEDVSPKYNSSTSININDFLNKINNKYPNENLTKDNLANNIKILNRSESGGVKEIQIGNEKIKGTDFRLLMNLNSTNFQYNINENEIIFECKGYGHGVGMSQWGANVMAEENKDYEYILKHYYNGVEIKSIRF